MVDRETFDRIKTNHASYASWAVWAEISGKPKSNIGDLSALDPDQSPTLLQTLRRDVVMVGLNISRPVQEPLRNFHDPRPGSQDYKIRYAFRGTPFYGAYMTDVIKGVVIVESSSLMRHLRENTQLVKQNVDRLLEEFSDLECANPTILAFGAEVHGLVARFVPTSHYSRLIKVTHYSHQISKEAYRDAVHKQTAAVV